jgi:hypothetical protein
MASSFTLAVVSDIHYASDAEKARGQDFELRGLTNPFARIFVKTLRHFIWLSGPLNQNHLLDRFAERTGAVDAVIANGDYSCDSAFIGVSDDAACQSVRECLGELRRKFAGKLRATIGDHEVGKVSLIGTRGGMRLASYQRAQSELGLESFWQFEAGRYVLMGVASPLAAFPVYEPDALPDERPEWKRLHADHLARVNAAFAALRPNQRVLLFCHDPTALPFLGRQESVRARLPQIEQTVIGHLHSNLVLRKGRLLAGMPTIRFLGNTVRRLSTSLGQARHWKPFNVRLCPALAGIELLKDGGFLKVELDPDANQPAKFQLLRLPR